MTQTMTIEEVLGLQYDVLGHYLVDNVFTEIRIIREGKQIYGTSKEDFITSAKAWLSSDSYVGINPRSVRGGMAEHVSYLTCLVIDIDPVRPKGEGSTEQQLQSSIDIGNRICTDFRGAVPVSSGSGCHVYFPIKPIRVDNRDILQQNVKKWMDAVREKYGNKENKIDSIFDLPRVIRLWGSKNTKSNRTCAPIGTFDSSFRFAYDFSQKESTKKSESLVNPDVLERFRSLCRSNKRLASIVGREITFASRSEADFDFIRVLHGAGFSVDEVESLVSENPLGRGFEKDIRQDVQRVFKKLDGAKPVSNGSQPGAEIQVRSLRSDFESYATSLDERKPGIQTGLGTFDAMVSGLKPGKLYIFAARPTEGKTSLITQILTNIAEQGKSCLFFPTEVGAEPIYDKIISSKSGVFLRKFQNGAFNEDEKKKVNETITKVKDLPLFIIEDFAVTADKVEEYVKKMVPQVLAYDYFQSTAWKDPDSVGEKNDMVYRLKKIARDYNIPVILASQLKRENGGKADLAQLKGTGALEEWGDVIAFLYQTDKQTYPVPTDLLVMKSKYSATGLIKLKFFKSICKLEVDETWKDNE